MDSYLRIYGRGVLSGCRDGRSGERYYTLCYMGGSFEWKENRDLSSLLGRFCQFSVLAVSKSEAKTFDGRSFVVNYFVPVTGAPVEIEEVK